MPADLPYARKGLTAGTPDIPYGDRGAARVEPFGITWWIATKRSDR